MADSRTGRGDTLNEAGPSFSAIKKIKLSAHTHHWDYIKKAQGPNVKSSQWWKVE